MSNINKEPIAIIGIGCRFPQAKNKQAFWQLLQEGVDAITEVPPERWDVNAVYTENAEKVINNRWGGFLEHLDQFDPHFFKISTREANTVDPQQRLLLEVAWEALEDAGQMPERLAGTKTGVFIGINGFDYYTLLMDNPAHNIDAYVGTGNTNCIAANRISYLFDFIGPSLGIDTACSSSLVAVHLACQSIWNGESTLALAGGVRIILSPWIAVSFAKAGFMAPDGRCKTFDSRANGYVRSEGAGVVVLKPLSQAFADKDPIYAVIRGSAINQDGRSNGLTAPNPWAQEAVLREAYRQAGISPEKVQYIEAHGTGTKLGDPIEMKALGKVLTQERLPDNYCTVGSVKTNIGHLEAAAGIAGLIKVALSLKHRQIPPNLHFQEPNPYIPFEKLLLRVPKILEPWPQTGDKAIAGVSSFSFGGTNAHVVLEEAPSVQKKQAIIERPWHLLTLSAKSEKALQELTSSYSEFLLTNPTVSLADVCFTASTGRSHFDYRLAVITETKEQLHKALNAFNTQGQTVGLVSNHIINNKQPRIAFLFTGQGSQYLNMGRQLYETQPTFRACLDRCNEILLSYLEQPLLSVLYPEDGIASPLNETAYTQPALFALEYALAKLWQSWGIEPTAVMGHSIGEYVAACVAGVFSLEDGLKLITERARLMQALPPLGEMVAVFASEAQVTAAIQFSSNEVSIAAINAPENIVISGMHQAVEAVISTLEAQGIETKRLKVSHAFHSPLMEPMLNVFEQQASQIQLRSPRLPLVSNVTGQFMLPEDVPDANYWRHHTRNQVRFMAGINTLLAQGYEIFLEIGPKPILSSLGKRCQQQENAFWLPSLASGKNDWQILLESLSTLYLQGVNINWSGFEQDYSRRLLSLPTYPFQRKRYWIEAQDTMNTKTNTTNGAKSPVAAFAKSKQREILQTLRSIVAKLLKADPSNIDVQAPFLEMGADSIVLVDAVRSIENTYGIKIAIRQLFEELTTLNALASYIEENIKSESVVAQDSSQPELASVVQKKLQSPFPLTTQNSQERNTLPTTVVEGIIQQQLHLMSQQLQVLQGSVPTESFVPSHNGHQKSANQTTPIVEPPQPLPQKQVTKTAPASVPSQLSSPLPPWRVAEIRARGLNPQQQRHLEDLIDRYTKSTPTSKQLTQTYRPVLADNRASAGFRFSTKEMLYPIVGNRSCGSKIWDVDGNEYIDITMGFGVNLFGHHPDFIIAALEEQIKQGIQIGPQTRLAGEVAQLICELTGLERVNFSNSGTEAVMTALRLARTATGRNKIAMFAGSYHGHFDGVLGMAQADNNPNAIPIAPGITPKTVEDILILEYGNPQSLEIIQAYAQELAAVLVEPVQSRRPDLQPQEFLHELRRLTREAGVLLIFDEMITGFRIHPGGAQAWFGIDADIATYGKIVGGGMPIGVVAGKGVYMDGIDGGMWNYGDASYPQADTTFFAGTFCKHPLAMAAAHAVLTQIKQRGYAVQQQLNQQTTQLASTLNTYFETENLPIRIINFGSLFRFDFLENADLLFYHLMNKGIYIWEGRNCFLSTAHTDEDINYFIQVVKESVEELRSGGFFPDSPSKSSSKGSNNTEVIVSQDVMIVPLTEAQKQLWILAQIGKDSSLAYNVKLSVQLKGVLHLEAMRQAVQKLVDRHEALRTTISSQGDFQQIFPSLKIDVPVVDFSSVNDYERESKVAEWFNIDSQEPFNLSQEPLFRIKILKLEEKHYLLVLSAHHIIVDGWSMAVMIQELGALYSAECQNVACQLAPAKQFREYMSWLEEQTQTEEMSLHESYWLKKFANSIPVLNLPTDRPYPPIKTYRGKQQRMVFDADFCREIKKIGLEQSCTLFMTLLSAYTVLLQRLTGQEEIIIGIPFAGRALENSDGLIGYCAHLLPICSNIIGNQTFLEYLKTFKGVLLETYEHQNYPFARLINKLSLRRDASHSPLIAATFNLERPFSIPEMFGLEAEWLSHPINFVDYDIDFNLTEINSDLVLDCKYNTDIFDDATIIRMMGHFRTLLAGIVANPEQKVSELPILTEAEQQQLLLDWNDTPTDYPAHLCVHQLFEEQVEQTPEAIAVVFESEQLTYSELNKRANQLAHHLQTLGVKPEVLVGICVERSLEMVVGLLGILKAGGAYVPLDPNYPAERLSYMLSDAGVEVLLTQQELLPSLPPHTARVVCLDTDWEVIEQHNRGNLASSVNADNLAYVIYTSGSTGQPKGVAIEHHSVVNFLNYVSSFLRLTQEDTFGAVTTISFDIAALELYLPLIVGAKVIVISDEIATDGNRLLSELCESKTSVVQATPATWQMLLAGGWSSNYPLKVLCGGEALSPHLARQILATGSELWNLYGPTEATIWSTLEQVRVATTEGKLSPIGRPIANTQIYILDREMRPVPIGVAGELHIGGDGLARGYLNRPELTQEKFVPNPFSSDKSARLYKTGDLARYLPDGNIEILGRIDHQVKIRGYRIELGEIEAVLSSHPQVQQTVVIASEDTSGNKRLIAYVVSKEEPLSSHQLRRFLQQELPTYMVPSTFVTLNTLPLTPNGKVDRKALKTPDGDIEREREYVAPQTEIQEILTTIWQELLLRDQVSIHDNFFEIGGDSVLSIQMIARANQLGLHFTPKQVFQQQTIAELANIVSTAMPIQAEQGLVTGSVPLTPIQHRFFEQNPSQAHHYNQSVLLEVLPDIQPNLLKQVVQQLLIHHDGLRLRYVASDSSWQQINITLDEGVPFIFIDLSAVAANQQFSAIESTMNELQASLNLSKGPIIQVALFYFGNNKPSRLLILIHHLAVDEVSWRILLEDLARAYQQLNRGEVIQLPPKTTAFRDWAKQLVEYGQCEALTTELDYWLEKSRLSIAPLPVDYSSDKQPNTVASAARVSVALSGEQTQALLQKAPQAYNTQIDDILLTALLQSFAQWTGKRSLLVELKGHGREELFENIDLSRTVGWFTSVFPILLELEEINCPEKTLKLVKEQLRRLPNRGIGYGILQYLSQNVVTRSKLKNLPQAEVSFNYLGQLDWELWEPPLLGFAKESTGVTNSPLRRAHLLEVEGFIISDRLQVNWIYSQNIHKRETVERLAQEFKTALVSLINHCQSLETKGYTPSDFSAARLNQKQLDAFLGKIKQNGKR